MANSSYTNFSGFDIVIGKPSIIDAKGCLYSITVSIIYFLQGWAASRLSILVTALYFHTYPSQWCLVISVSASRDIYTDVFGVNKTKYIYPAHILQSVSIRYPGEEEKSSPCLVVTTIKSSGALSYPLIIIQKARMESGGI